MRSADASLRSTTSLGDEPARLLASEKRPDAAMCAAVSLRGTPSRVASSRFRPSFTSLRARDRGQQVVVTPVLTREEEPAGPLSGGKQNFPLTLPLLDEEVECSVGQPFPLGHSGGRSR